MLTFELDTAPALITFVQNPPWFTSDDLTVLHYTALSGRR